MKTAIIAAILTLSTLASAEPKERKVRRPVVCMTWETFRSEHGSIVQCTDGKRPVTLRSYTVVQMLNEDGAPTRYLVGWR